MPRPRGSRQPSLFRLLDETYAIHRAARDRLTVLISAKGADPVAAEVDYEPPGRFGNAVQIEAVARTDRAAGDPVYAELVANTSGEDRRWAITALDASALRELDFGVAPGHLPGPRLSPVPHQDLGRLVPRRQVCARSPV